LAPLATTITAVSSARRRKTIDLAISATLHPRPAAAWAEVLPLAGSRTTGLPWPILEQIGDSLARYRAVCCRIHGHTFLR
jgi:hypothetical protein